MTLMHSIKYGDPICTRGCHKSLALFFYNHDGTSSNYAPSIINQLIDYELASDKERKIIDLHSSINCYSKEGKGVAGDMVCEWAVKSVKGIQSRFTSNYEATLAKRSVKTANITRKISQMIFLIQC